MKQSERVILYDFLVSNIGDGALSNYIDNIQDITKLSNLSLSSGISGAFTWIDTPEGHNYWSEIGSKWGRYIGRDSMKIIGGELI